MTTTGKMLSRRSFHSLASSSFSSLMRNKNTANDLFFNLAPSSAFLFSSRRSLCDDDDGIIAPFTRQFMSSSSSKNVRGGHGFQLGELLFAAGRRRRSKRDALFVDWNNSSTSKTSSARFFHASSSVLFSNKATDSESKFTEKANEYLELLGEKLEQWADDEIEEDVECDYSDGVLTISLGRERGTYVLNKQAPNKQIWWSSPISGPHRFEEDGARWADARRGQDGDDCLDDLETKLRKEWGEIFKGKKGLDL